MSTPARNYKWADFEPDNLVALRHGARSARTVRPVAEKVAAELAKTAPWTAQPAFAAEVQAWAWAEARCILLRAWVDEHGILDADGEPIPALSELERAEGRAGRLRSNLGLNPAAWAKLLNTLATAKDATADAAVDDLRAVGARILEATTSQEATDAQP